ncbi:hypothetical protein R1flu_012674 [Riccia fluitans]|uniref:Uncharacterized protein n=1 Tax=Riccia fluitans TaxID=41844 RepID=A0ABD1ZB97_9MARC
MIRHHRTTYATVAASLTNLVDQLTALAYQYCKSTRFKQGSLVGVSGLLKIPRDQGFAQLSSRFFPSPRSVGRHSTGGTSASRMRLVREDWPLEDPKGKSPEKVKEIRDKVKEHVLDFLARQGWEKKDE